MENALHNIQKGFDGLYANFDMPIVGAFLRGPIGFFARINGLSKGPSDKMTQRVARIMQRQSDQRDRLTEGIYMPTNENDAFANYWVHNAFITMSNEKMAKSQGNILKINDFRGKINGQVLRLALMSTHYKQPLDWNDELINYCQNTLNKWYESYIELTKQVMIPEEFLNPLYDDLNTPGYIANLHKLFEKSQKGELKDKEIFTSACNFIGLLSDTKKKWVEFKKSKSEISEKEILSKVKERNEARDNKNYKLADKIRNELLDKGVSIEDKDGKTIWKFK